MTVFSCSDVHSIVSDSFHPREIMIHSKGLVKWLLWLHGSNGYSALDVSCERMENGGERSHQKSTGQGHSGPRCKVVWEVLTKWVLWWWSVQTYWGWRTSLRCVWRKIWVQLESVIDHLQTHNGAQFCHVCCKSCSKSTKMERHMRTHTGETVSVWQSFSIRPEICRCTWGATQGINHINAQSVTDVSSLFVCVSYICKHLVCLFLLTSWA